MTDETYTLAKLSEFSGVSQRNCRFYLEQGLVPPPTGKGRKSRYGPAQLATLRVISELRAAGLPLDVIREYLSGLDIGATDSVDPPTATSVLQTAGSLEGESGASGEDRSTGAHGLGSPFRALSGPSLAAAALDYVAKARAAASTASHLPSDLVGQRLAALGRGYRKQPENDGEPSTWERIPISSDLEINVRSSYFVRQSDASREEASETESANERALSLALSILRESPDGIRFKDLVRDVLVADPVYNPESVPYLMWRLFREHPYAVFNSSDGVVRLAARADSPPASRDMDTPGSRVVSDHPGGTQSHVRVLCRLVAVAENRETLRYADLAVALGITPRGASMGAKVGKILDAICADEVASGRPMLSAVVVGYNGRPGAGFFATAQALGRLDSTIGQAEFWSRELEEVYACWRRPVSKP